MPALVSVVTPFYNTEAYLAECIESVLKRRRVQSIGTLQQLRQLVEQRIEFAVILRHGHCG